MDNEVKLPTKVPRDFESLRSTIIERKDAMPKRLAQVAAFALTNPDEIAFGTTASIAAASEVQPSTLVRLAHHLGYEGFSDLQSIFRERLRDRTLSYEERLVSLEQSGAEDEDASILSGFMSAASQSINRLAATVQTEAFARSVDILAAADTIYLIAKRRSYPLTAHMTYAFSKLGIRHQIVASPNGVDPELVQFATPQGRGDRRELFALCSRKPDAEPGAGRSRSARDRDHRFGLFSARRLRDPLVRGGGSRFRRLPLAFRIDGADHGLSGRHRRTAA